MTLTLTGGAVALEFVGTGVSSAFSVDSALDWGGVHGCVKGQAVWWARRRVEVHI
jgi:hypothetical protein